MKTQNDILEELSTVAPELAKLKKKVSHDIPANYFNSFSGSMLKKIREEELKSVAPSFSELERLNTMKTPASYFKEFPLLMLEKVKQESKPESNIAPTWEQKLKEWADKIAAVVLKPKYAYAFAGTVTMLVIGTMLMFNTEQTACAPEDLVCQLENVSDEELDAYIYSNADEFQKSVLDISTDDNRIEKRADDINKELNKLLNELDEQTINSI